MRGKLVLLSLAVCVLLSSCSNKVNTLKIMHANVNCSNFEESLSFYETLGFVSPMDTDVTVSAEDAAVLSWDQLHSYGSSQESFFFSVP